MRLHLGTIAVGSVLAATTLTSCGQDTSTPDPDEDRSSYTTERQLSDFSPDDPETYSAEIELPDGRRVSMFYAPERGLAEQHYSPEEDAWTEPQIIYPTETDPCQGITLDEEGGTVSVIADWNLYCYDGEPPDESIAGVATGDLTEWETDLTRGFDGWSGVQVTDDGATVVWTHQDDRLTWTADDGFAQ